MPPAPNPMPTLAWEETAYHKSAFLLFTTTTLPPIDPRNAELIEVIVIIVIYGNCLSFKP